MPKKILIALCLAAMACPQVLAEDDDFIMNTDGIGQSHNGVITSDQFLELGSATPNALRLEAENSLRMGHLNRAIMVLQHSLEQAPLDIDTRMLYAEALEKKLVRQKDRDPKLYNFVLKQWLYIAKKAEFPDQKLTGAAHLFNMTGTSPKMMESTKKFLGRVLLPEDGSAKVALGGSNPAQARADSKRAQRRANDDDVGGSLDK